MRVQGYQLDIFAPPCDPGAERWSVKAALDDDICEVLPFLNTVLKSAIYNHAARALTWRMGGHNHRDPANRDRDQQSAGPGQCGD